MGVSSLGHGRDEEDVEDGKRREEEGVEEEGRLEETWREGEGDGVGEGEGEDGERSVDAEEVSSTLIT